ncbi:MAG: LacI family DNA-binding transcriptional regulator [Kiritimatiellales bacterium]
MNSRSKQTHKISSTADLARYLGLSQWTVSRAINNHKDISEATRRRVMDAMDETGFRPNLFARGLRGRSSRMIGISFFRLNVPILNQKVLNIQTFFREKQYQCLLETTDNDLEQEIQGIRNLLKIHVDGIVLIQSGLTVEQMGSLAGSVPWVLVDPGIPAFGGNAVYLDRAVAQRRIFEHLYTLGHRKFALLGYGKNDKWRWPALQQAAIDFGMNPAKEFTALKKQKGDRSEVAAGVRMAEEIIHQSPRPTALICLNDFIALGVIQALQHAGFSVPADFSVTGFDNLSSSFYPILTTIDQRVSVMMKEAGNLLLRQIDAPDFKHAAESIRIEPEFIIGESTGPVPE